MAHLDFKVTSWRRVFVPDDKIEETIKLLKEGSCDTPYDLMDIKGYYDATTYDDQCCEEPMLPNENEDSSTQELYSEDGNIVYRNGNEE